MLVNKQHVQYCGQIPIDSTSLMQDTVNMMCLQLTFRETMCGQSLTESFLLLLSSAPHMNINLEMNYWPCLPCNLAECQEALFDFLSSLSVNGSKTAEVSI